MAKLDAEKEKTCLEEISHLIFDAGKNVTLPMLSHNHGFPFIQCSELLDRWLKVNRDHTGKVSCSYYVQYLDEESNPAVRLVSYDNLKLLKINKKNKNVHETLFGISLSTSNRALGLKERFDNLHIPIKATCGIRTVEPRPIPAIVTEPKIHIKADKVTNAGTKNISNMFGKGPTASGSKEVKKEVVTTKKSPVKTETIKKESPPTKKESPKKAVKVGASSSKGNIASFFSKAQAKPTTSKAAPSKIPTIEKSEPKKETPKHFSTIIDSDDDDEVVPGTPQEKRTVRRPPVKNTKTKKAPPKVTQSKQHSRIAVMEDSSESEVEEERDMKRKEQQIELHISDAEDMETERSPEKPKKPEVKLEVSGTKRRTGKRQVIRKYQDENGFMVTRKETEEYFLSDEETEPVEKKSKPEDVQRKPEPKQEVPKPVAKTKQKNIMSFFTRK